MWLLVLVVAVAFWGAFTWLVSFYPGDQAIVSAVFGGILIGVLFAMRQSPPTSIASWEEGAYGEEETAKQLRLLEREGWVVLHDLANGTRNFDHVVLGPSGVYCLNSKWSGYRLELASGGGMVGRHAYDDEVYIDVTRTLRRARSEAAELNSQIAQRCGQKVWVQPVVVWWGEVAGGGKSVDGVGVVQGRHLAERLGAQKGRPVRDFDAVVAVLRPGRHMRQRGEEGRAPDA
ncbi:nuclease-related domain-containing protein [Cellulomonas sp.]|uniref:nuclease-related domain-containing protein n=1 Tax=Cellulomonas sp. TaxID=40001 RepID=UPI002811627C|nr:nuclease-related domain-containing protein [Cellulomonas sp.]